MSAHEYNDNNDAAYQYPESFSRQDPSSSRRRTRESRKRRSHRHGRTQSEPQPIPDLPDPVVTENGAAEAEPPRIYLSPPPRDGRASPPTEIALLPGGGVEIPAGFHFNQADQGMYRPRGGNEEGGPDQPRVLGGLGFGMLKGLRKLPAAIVRAGRGTKPRQDVGTTSEDRANLQIDDDVETYVTQLGEDEGEAEGRVREEDLLRDYIQRRRLRRDRTYRHSARVRREPYVPAPQPVPVPGSRTPAPSAAGYPEQQPVSALEAEEIAIEGEALVQAQERERLRNIYAAEAVKSPSSVSYAPESRRTHHRTVSAPPPPPPRVFSRWAAERDLMGQRVENSSDISVSFTSPLSFAGLLRLLQQIRDMPWVSERVAADYIPGGLRPSPSDYVSASGHPAPGTDISYVPPVQMLPPPPGQSWYAPQGGLILPEGVAPPPGFVPYQGGNMPATEAFRASSASSDTHVEMPIPVHTPNPSYVDDEAYHYTPTEASATGQSYIAVPTQHAGSVAGSYAHAM